MFTASAHPKGITEKGLLEKPVEISIWLDTFDDMFSDFDPRPYSERTVSDDFITEVKKVARGRAKGRVVLKLLLPVHLRKTETERIIIKRLHNRFNFLYDQLLGEKKKNIVRGFIFTLAGIVLMIIASYISFLQPQEYFIHLLLILFEPAGWFLLWLGLDHLVYFSRSSIKELDFYSKIRNSRIEFDSY